MYVGYCDNHNLSLGPSLAVDGNTSGVEGTRITVHCQHSKENLYMYDDRTTAIPYSMICTCMRDGSWIPNPHDMDCSLNNNTNMSLSISLTTTSSGIYTVSMFNLLLISLIWNEHVPHIYRIYFCSRL